MNRKNTKFKKYWTQRCDGERYTTWSSGRGTQTHTMSGSHRKTVTMPRMRSKTSTKNSQQSPGHVLTTPGVSSPWLRNYDLSWSRSLLPWLNLSVTPCPQSCSWIGCHSGCIEDDASKGGGDVMTTHSFHILFLILSLISLFFILSFVSLGHVTSLSKDWVMWYDVIRNTGSHQGFRVPSHSRTFHGLPFPSCNVIPLCLSGHFSVVYIGLLYHFYNLRIDLV